MPEKIDTLISQLSALSTEDMLSREDLNKCTTLEMVQEMNQMSGQVLKAVSDNAKEIASSIDTIAERMRAGGRLIYIGAGTAGRIGVLDASEIPPTFGTSPDRVIALIAGGEGAISQAVEGAEDDSQAAVEDLREHAVCEADCLVGISASGRSPYVVSGIEFARSHGAFTVALSSNRRSLIGRTADVAIELETGPEFIAGSTRLKAGTGQKMVLNMVSTLAMVRLGKTYRGVMVDLQATNKKLHARSVRTVMEISGVSSSVAVDALEKSSGSVKIALLSILAGISPRHATTLLNESEQHLAVALEIAKKPRTGRAQGSSA